MDRLQAFESLATHSWFSKAFKRLSTADLQICRTFLANYSSDDRGAFDMKVNRMFLDKEKPKNCRFIQDLLCGANIIANPLKVPS